MRKRIVQGVTGSLGHGICGHPGACGVRIGSLGLQLAGLVEGPLALGPLGASLALGCCSKGPSVVLQFLPLSIPIGPRTLHTANLSSEASPPGSLP